jgi:hypothetical protein
MVVRVLKALGATFGAPALIMGACLAAVLLFMLLLRGCDLVID